MSTKASFLQLQQCLKYTVCVQYTTYKTDFPLTLMCWKPIIKWQRSEWQLGRFISKRAPPVGCLQSAVDRAKSGTTKPKPQKPDNFQDLTQQYLRQPTLRNQVDSRSQCIVVQLRSPLCTPVIIDHCPVSLRVLQSHHSRLTSPKPSAVDVEAELWITTDPGALMDTTLTHCNTNWMSQSRPEPRMSVGKHKQSIHSTHCLLNETWPRLCAARFSMCLSPVLSLFRNSKETCVVHLKKQSQQQRN